MSSEVEALEFEHWAFVALGSNQGNSREILQQAMDRLQEFSEKPLLKSSLWQTTPVDCPPGSPDFVNAVVGLAPRLSETSDSLLAELQKLELEFGRQPKKIINEPRPLDLDLIAFGQEIRASKRLTIPHPRTHLRQFVLRPLVEITPNFRFPGSGQMAKEILEQLKTGEIVRRIE